jgi:hypothetical protein
MPASLSPVAWEYLKPDRRRTMREVTERDLRMPEFRDARPEELEFREDGKLVRKDRWEVALRNVASTIGWARREFEVHEVSAEVGRIKELADASVKPRALKALKAEALEIFDGPECPQEVRDAIEWFASSIDTILADEDGVDLPDGAQQ